MAAYVGYQKGTELLMEGANAGTDAWRLILSNTTPDVVNNTTAVSCGELATGGGYTAGGVVATLTSSSQTAGLYKLILSAPASPAWTASAAGFAFRYLILYNLTNTQAVGVWDYGSTVTMNGANGDQFTPTLDAVNGVFTLATPV